MRKMFIQTVTQVACEPALRGALAAGREKKGELATTSLEFQFRLQFPCGSPSTELSDFRQSARSGNKRECKQTLKNTWKHAPRVTSLLSSPPISQQFRIDRQSAPDSLLVGYDTGGREVKIRQLQTGVEPMTSWSVGQMLYHQATGDLVTDPGEGAGGGGVGWPFLIFGPNWGPKVRKKFFPRPPPPLLSKGLDDRPPETLRSWRN